MTRMMFGGGIADWAFGADDEGKAQIVGAAVIKFYNAEEGGSQIVDLQDLVGTAITQVVTSDGLDAFSLGQIPPLYGPDAVYEMWASANDGPRVLMTAVNLGSFLGPVRDAFYAHIAPGSLNPHATGFLNLAGVDAASFDSVAAGSVVQVGSSGLLVAGAAVTGGTAGPDAVSLTVDEQITGAKIFDTNEATKVRVTVRAKGTGQTANIFEAYSGTDTGQGGVRQLTTYLNEKGELRAICAKTASVAARFKGQPGQTANIFEITDTSNSPKLWAAPNYGWYAANSGFPLTWVDEGDITVSAGTFGWWNDLDVAVSLRSFRASLTIPYASGSLVLKPKVVSATGVVTEVFASGSRPTIAAGDTTTGKLNTFASAVVPVGSQLLVDVLTIGAGNVGKGLYAQAMLW